ncbi:MAG: J domain-containing protein [Armatimonadota bacterium]
MRTADNYELLGVSRYASRDAVKRAFRHRLLEIHPDRNPGDSLAAERTRRVIEAYRALTSPPEPSSAECGLASCPNETLHTSSERVRRVVLPEWTLRVLGVFVALAVMAWAVLGIVRAVLGSTGPVFRPDPDALHSSRVQTRLIAAIFEPRIDDCMEWYCAQQYQLGAGSDWDSHAIVKIYQQAALRARLRGDLTRASFYTSAVREITAAKPGTLF